ncbi:MAG: hypothetical protein H5U40_08460, partial [Polyangiaceae bacterium]|nr:hypothetical protein [Polyangiaceae bacterium]
MSVDVPLSPTVVWARVESAFRCRECGQLTPVNGLLLDDVATCVHCDSTQALDVSVWEEALAHAHAAADIGRPGAAAALDLRGTALEPFSRGEVRARFEAAGVTMDRGVMRTRSFVLTAGPGHPVATVGGGPLDVRIERSGQLVSRDTRTGAMSAFSLPSAARERCPSLVAVVAPDQRVGDADARVEAAGAVATLACPTCAAALDVEPGQHFVRCTYCSTACRIPSRTVRQLEGAAARSEAYFLCFEGPSPARGKLEERARIEALQNEQEERRSAERREALGEIERADPIPRSSNAQTLASGCVMVLIVLVGLIGYRGRIEGALGLDVAPPSLTQGLVGGATAAPIPGAMLPPVAREAPVSAPMPAPRGGRVEGCGCTDPAGPLFELWLVPNSA